MSDTINPYQSPQADIKPNLLNSPGGLTESMMTYLRDASPWLRFIGVLSFIGCGFIALMGILSLLAPGFGNFYDLWESWGGAVAAFGVFYLGIAVLMIFPARFIYNFGTKIRNYLRSGAEQDLELAFKNNKSLWKFYGIMSIVYLAITPVLIVVGIIVVLNTSGF